MHFLNFCSFTEILAVNRKHSMRSHPGMQKPFMENPLVFGSLKSPKPVVTKPGTKPAMICLALTHLLVNQLQVGLIQTAY